MSLENFLDSQKQIALPDHIVVGNAAGDADSIVSAITLAYIESVYGKTPPTPKTPIVSISKRDLETQRPEVSFLFKTLGLTNIVNSLWFIDDIVAATRQQHGDTKKRNKITLVDHNRLEGVFSANDWEVVEILDHHYDEQQHLDSCSGSSRHIAFQDDKALVASTCTLITETWKSFQPSKYHATVSLLLLSTILLDSVNMIPQAGKGTPRDAAAIQDLLENTDWSTISSEKAVSTWWPDADTPSRTLPLPPGSKPDTNRIFESLQAAKFDPDFWKRLSVQDSLRLDYKRFSATRQGDSSKSDHNTNYVFGASSVLLSMQDFLSKPDILQGIYQYMTEEASIEILAILFFYKDIGSGANCRQLILCGLQESSTGNLVDEMTAYLLQDGTLKLEENTKENDAVCTGKENISMRLFDQGNVKASRKQVAPLIIRFFETR